MRTFLSLLASLALSLVVGSAVAYVAVETLPCRWFGTAFEGACAYGVLWVSIWTGTAVALLAFAYLCYRVLRRRAPAGPPVSRLPARGDAALPP